MAAKEIFDYLTVVTPDVDVTLSLAARGEQIVERGAFNQVVHKGDDGSRVCVDLGGSVPTWYVDIPFDILTESDMGTIMDLYFNASYAVGRLKSFKWASDDGHTYVVAFDCDLDRIRYQHGYHGASITLQILGKAS